MENISTVAEKKEGFNHVIVELNEHEVVILNQALKSFEQYDKDDYVYRDRLEGLKEGMHKARGIVRPS